MMNQDLKTIAVERALAHGLNPAIVCAVVEQESAWNPWAIRYEPAFEARYLASMSLGATERKARATSWGLMQVLGEVARELGFAERYLSQLADPFLGCHYGCLKLVECYAKSGGDETAALQRYNGGANLAYATQVLARISRYQ